MKSYSLHHIYVVAANAFRRFPMALICAVLATASALYLIDFKGNEDELSAVVQLVMTFALGMISYIGLAVFAQRYTMRQTTVFYFHVIVAALMIYYYYSLPDTFTVKALARFVLLFLAAHLGVSFAPFMVTTEVNGFWQFNKSLFIRFLTGGLYSGVLFGGLSIALLAIDNLFSVDIAPEVYLRMFCVIAGVFNTWFFLSGMPPRILSLETVTEYPKGLRVFTQYVLMPLVVIYLLILYVYGAKIIFTMVWPRGIVSYLIIGFSALGILALLLVWPLRDDDHYAWIRSYTRRFFIAIFPLIILLSMAIGRRVIEYGVTENRYFLIILALWLLVVAVYFLLSHRKHIKFIPLSLFFAALLSGYGPWNAFSVSEDSQHSRLVKLLSKNNILKDGKVAKIDFSIPTDDQVEISSIVSYMIEVHGLPSIQDLFAVNLIAATNNTAKVSSSFKAGRVMDLMGLDYKTQYIDPNQRTGVEYLNYSSNVSPVTDVRDYDYLFPLDIYMNSSSSIINRSIDSSEVEIAYNKGNYFLKVSFNHSGPDTLSLRPMISTLVKKYGHDDYSVNEDELSVDFTGSDKIHYHLLIKGIAATRMKESDELMISSLNGVMLIDLP
ncbi:MAG TPA: DUF4153 domain-containing protein [Bacteroidia bacterium]|jgi:hypothetical protein|nr:DUF4153 domain-containing protein [Bacteroidia bacterium]